MFTNVYSPIILCYILIFLCIAVSQISNNHLLFGTLMHSAIVQASVWYLNVLHIQRRRVFMEEKHDRSKNGNLLPNYMATLQVQQRNSPPVITYINILITSECTANGRWLNTKGVIRHPRWILFARYQRTKPGEQLMLQVGSFPQVTRQTSGTAQGRATTLRTYRLCELVDRHAAKLEDINVDCERDVSQRQNHPSVVTEND